MSYIDFSWLTRSNKLLNILTDIFMWMLHWLKSTPLNYPAHQQTAPWKHLIPPHLNWAEFSKLKYTWKVELHQMELLPMLSPRISILLAFIIHHETAPQWFHPGQHRGAHIKCNDEMSSLQSEALLIDYIFFYIFKYLAHAHIQKCLFFFPWQKSF